MILDGKSFSRERTVGFKEEVVELKSRLGRAPSLCVVLVGDDPASQVYVRHKHEQCEAIGVLSKQVKLPSDISSEELRRVISDLNESDEVDGILVQLPLPENLRDFDPFDYILPEKDVDGLTAQNMGLMIKGKAYAEPCTPKGVVSLLKRNNIKISGKKAVVLGRSQIVGWPMAWMLTRENATVTVCHSRTNDLKGILKESDLVVVAVGSPEFLSVDDFKEGSCVVDVGIHRKENKRLVGDVNTQNFKDKGISYTPVPGGVGPMTVSTLLENLISLVNHKIKKEG